MFSSRTQGFKQHWPIGDDQGLKKKADFGLKTLNGGHMILIAEAKTIDNHISCDLMKLACCRKASVDRSKQQGYENAAVCGLFIKGPLFKILYMDHAFKGGYRLLDVFTFMAPTNRDDVENIRKFYHGTIVLNRITRKVTATYRGIPTRTNIPMATMLIEVTKSMYKKKKKKQFYKKN